MPSQRARGSVRFGVVLALAILILAPPASAFEFGKGKVKGSWDTTVSFGVSYRLDDPDPTIIGLANGGTAYSVNGDDGNLNYDVGVFSLVPKVNTELGLDFGDHFGLFVRGFAFYDYENEDRDRVRTPWRQPKILGHRKRPLPRGIGDAHGVALDPQRAPRPDEASAGREGPTQLPIAEAARAGAHACALPSDPKPYRLSLAYLLGPPRVP